MLDAAARRRDAADDRRCPRPPTPTQAHDGAAGAARAGSRHGARRTVLGADARPQLRTATPRPGRPPTATTPRHRSTRRRRTQAPRLLALRARAPARRRSPAAPAGTSVPGPGAHVTVPDDRRRRRPTRRRAELDELGFTVAERRARSTARRCPRSSSSAPTRPSAQQASQGQHGDAATSRSGPQRSTFPRSAGRPEADARRSPSWPVRRRRRRPTQFSDDVAAGRRASPRSTPTATRSAPSTPRAATVDARRLGRRRPESPGEPVDDATATLDAASASPSTRGDARLQRRPSPRAQVIRRPSPPARARSVPGDTVDPRRLEGPRPRSRCPTSSAMTWAQARKRARGRRLRRSTTNVAEPFLERRRASVPDVTAAGATTLKPRRSTVTVELRARTAAAQATSRRRADVEHASGVRRERQPADGDGHRRRDAQRAASSSATRNASSSDCMWFRRGSQSDS